MLDTLIKIDNVESATGFDPVTLLATRNKVITYHIGHYGPFRAAIKESEFTPEQIEAKLNRELATLRAIGTIPA